MLRHRPRLLLQDAAPEPRTAIPLFKFIAAFYETTTRPRGRRHACESGRGGVGAVLDRVPMPLATTGLHEPSASEILRPREQSRVALVVDGLTSLFLMVTSTAKRWTEPTGARARWRRLAPHRRETAVVTRALLRALRRELSTAKARLSAGCISSAREHRPVQRQFVTLTGIDDDAPHWQPEELNMSFVIAMPDTRK